MQHDAEIWGILDAEETSASERAFWMAGLPKQTGALVRVAIAATAAMVAIEWHTKTKTLPKGCTTLWEARRLQEDLSNELQSILSMRDCEMFERCVALIEDMPHSDTDCALCLDTPVIFTDKVSWQKLTV
jgi:hypothetical protein